MHVTTYQTCARDVQEIIKKMNSNMTLKKVINVEEIVRTKKYINHEKTINKLEIATYISKIIFKMD